MGKPGFWGVSTGGWGGAQPRRVRRGLDVERGRGPRAGTGVSHCTQDEWYRSLAAMGDVGVSPWNRGGWPSTSKHMPPPPPILRRRW